MRRKLAALVAVGALVIGCGGNDRPEPGSSADRWFALNAEQKLDVARDCRQSRDQGPGLDKFVELYNDYYVEPASGSRDFGQACATIFGRFALAGAEAAEPEPPAASAGSGPNPGAAGERRYAEGSPEYNLAVIDSGGGSPSDTEVTPYARALDVLEDKCSEEERSRLADYAAVTAEATEATTLEAVRGVATSIPSAAVGQVDCAEQFAAYRLLVEQGAQP